MLWYCGILTHQARIGWHLEVSRKAFWEQDPHDEKEYVERAEIIDHAWVITSTSEMADGFVELESQPVNDVLGANRNIETSDVDQVEEPNRQVGNRGGPIDGARRLSDSF